MAKRKLEWSIEARDSLESILQFYIERNGNKSYSSSLFKIIKQTISLIQNNNSIGKATDEDETRVLSKGHYAIFYEVKEKVIESQLIWDNRRNPDDLQIQTLHLIIKYPDRTILLLNFKVNLLRSIFIISMNDRNTCKNENECIGMLRYLFENALDILKEIAPNGWRNSQCVCFLHPTSEQQFEEHKRMNENLNKLSKNPKPDIKIVKNSIEDFRQDELEGINDKEEFIYILGLSIYDIFSNNHEVIGVDKRIYDFGSLRGSGGFIADFINDYVKDTPKHYDYIDFTWVRFGLKKELI